VQACEKLREIYGDEALKERQCQYWFACFCSGDCSMKDAPRSGWPLEVDNEKIKALVEANRHSTIRELADALKISIGSVHLHLKQLGYINKLDVWVPHELKKVYLTQRIDIYDQLVKFEQSNPFLKRMITEDEKWIVYNNVQRKRS